MPDLRPCAKCNKSIQWVQRSSSGMAALDIEPQGKPAPDVEFPGLYALVDGQAVHWESLHELTQEMWQGPLFRAHVVSCQGLLTESPSPCAPRKSS